MEEQIQENGKKILFVVAPENFRDEEYFLPKKILEEADFKVVTCSLIENSVSKSGKEIKVDVLLDSIDSLDYDAIVFVGGSGAVVYFENEKAQQLAKEFCEDDKVTGAICIAPSILANSGVLNGKKATCWSSEEENLIEKGAELSDEEVCVDGKIVTGCGPEAAEEFGEKLVKALQEL